MTTSLRGNAICALKSVPAVLALSLLFCFAQVSLCAGQTQTVSKSSRKVVRSTPPEYPTALKHINVRGSVRLLVTVLPNGDVTKVDPLGGNAIFVESATKAVLKWKYVSTGAQTTEEVEIIFNPD